MRIAADVNIPFVKECFRSIGEVMVMPGRAISAERIAESDCLLVRSVSVVDKDLLEGGRVKFVGTATTGYDHIDSEYLRRRGIGFASAPGSNSNSVAEYVVAGLLSVGQKHKIKLEGASIGIIGVGNIGSEVERKCKALGMEVVLNDPPLRRRSGDEKYRPIEEVLDCDFVTLHTPLSYEGPDRTYHLADERFFESIKDGCVFINTSRGAVTKSEALKSAIKSGKAKAAVLDVWENEPDIDMELLRMVDISTPHIAGYSLDGKVNGMLMIYKSACEYFGIEAVKDIEDFLPEPDVPEIRLDNRDEDEEEIIHQAVQQVYPVNRDDFNTREIAVVSEEERGRFFDKLREDYPVRREFQNTKVILEANCKNLARKLEGIGFKVFR